MAFSEKDISSLDIVTPSALLKDLNPDLQTTLTVDISDDKPVESSQSVEEQVQESDIKSSESSKNLLKITITKQSIGSHSILKIYNPNEPQAEQKLSPIEAEDSPKCSPIPKLTIKPVKPDTSPLKLTIRPVLKQEETQENKSKLYEVEHVKTSPKIIIKPLIKPDDVVEKETHKHKYSPKLTIKPIVKPEEAMEANKMQKTGPKVTIKPIIKHDSPIEAESSTHSPRIVKHDNIVEEQKSSPKLIIKPVLRPEDCTEVNKLQKVCPKLTIKPIIKPEEVIESEQPVHSPRITIKPIVKPEEQRHSPKITIKPIVKPEEETGTNSPRITIKPLENPDDKCDEVANEVVDSSKGMIKQGKILQRFLIISSKGIINIILNTGFLKWKAYVKSV